jgi:acyl carrier protein
MSAENTQALVDVFVSELRVAPGQVVDTLSYDSTPQWDSLAHMGLVAALEQRFDIMLDTSDIIEMSSVSKAREILGRHGVAFG